MRLNMFRRADGHTPVRPPGRHAWATGTLLVVSVVLLIWAGSSLVDARPADSRADQGPEVGRDAAQQERRAPALTPDDRRLLRAARRETTLIEPPLAASSAPLQAGGATVQAPQDVAAPTRITIPRLDINQDLTELDVVGSTLQVPDDYDDIGWWGAGPVPGRQGSAVVVGHLDSPTGPAVFYGLSEVARDSRVQVRLDDGSRAIFAVTDVEVYDRDEFPSTKVYQSRGRPGLFMVTCGGTFDAGTQEYSSNVVVSSRLVERIPAGARSDDGPTSDAGTNEATNPHHDHGDGEDPTT